jgi:hypothetical protein
MPSGCHEHYCGGVSIPEQEPTDADGPFVRAAFERARAVDDAAPGQRRPAWLRLLLAAGLALAEGLLRDACTWGAVLLSIVAVAFGATSGDIAWAVSMIMAGVAGVVLVFWSIARRWSFGWHWTVLLSVTIGQIALLVGLWRTH